jgi:hypothetical protein
MRHYLSENAERWIGFDHRPGDIVISTRSKCETTWMQMICCLLVHQRTDLPAHRRPGRGMDRTRRRSRVRRDEGALSRLDARSPRGVQGPTPESGGVAPPRWGQGETTDPSSRRRGRGGAHEIEVDIMLQRSKGHAEGRCALCMYSRRQGEEQDREDEDTNQSIQARSAFSGYFPGDITKASTTPPLINGNDEGPRPTEVL